MPGLATTRARTIALAFALAAALLCAPLAANATSPKAHGATPTGLAAKKSQQAATQAQLRILQADLETRVSDYVAIARELQRTRAEILQVSAQLGEQTQTFELAKTALTDRAVQLYRGDHVGMLELLLDSRSIQELVSRASYLTTITQRDSRMLNDVRLARSETMWLQGDLDNRVGSLTALMTTADTQRSRIESDMAAQQKAASSLGTDIVKLLTPASAPATTGASAPSGRFSPDMIVTDASFRASTSMSAAEIQGFLDQQPGSLKSYRALDHTGVSRTAAEMIAEAASGWNVSPKMILVTLQKEQSLLEKAAPTPAAYDWAMGCGKADSRTYYQYQGFGRQVWFGASKLSGNAAPWHQGIKVTIDGSAVSPINASTYSLYKYTPHFRGVMSFWLLHWRYFGDPIG